MWYILIAKLLYKLLYRLLQRYIIIINIIIKNILNQLAYKFFFLIHINLNNFLKENFSKGFSIYLWKKIFFDSILYNILNKIFNINNLVTNNSLRFISYNIDIINTNL